jgi:cysteine-rich repeat protein
MNGITPCKWLVAVFFAIAVLALGTLSILVEPAGAQDQCPKLSPASLDLDTAGCPTTFGPVVVEKRTEWELDKDAVTVGPIDATSDGAYSYQVKVTEGPTTRILQSTGQIVITNSGEQSPFLESVVVNLQRYEQVGKQMKFVTKATAIAVRSVACKDGINISPSNPEGALTCLGDFLGSTGASLMLTDLLGNDVTALTNPPVPAPGLFPIPPTPQVQVPVDNDGDGLFNEDPVDGVDNDLDGFIDEDPVDFALVYDCTQALKINFKAEYDLAGLGINQGDTIRIEVLVTFGGAGRRGRSPDSVSCTKDINCNGTIDGDDPTTCGLNESENDNVRTIAQRGVATVPADTPVCQDVTVSDPGTVSNNTSCVSVSDSTNSANGAMIMASGTAGTTSTFSVSGTATCVDGACNTTITDTATLTCDNGRNELISGSPASASIDVTCMAAPLPECGNGIVEAGEQCDDGNNINGDGCSAVCTTEQVGEFCTRTQGCWGQVGDNAPCRSRLVEHFDNDGVNDGGPFFIGEGVTCATNSCGTSGTLDGGGDGTFAATWTSANGVRDYLPAGETSGTLSADLTNPTTTSSGVFDGQLLAAELNVYYNDAGLSPVVGTNTTTKLGDLKYQTCSAYTIGSAIVGKTLRQVIDAANRVTSGEFGVFTSPSAPSQSVTIPSFGTVTIDELKTALDAFNNNYDACTVNLGCLMP